MFESLGVTCLFIAAKIEEIYPPKLQEFSYVTDGACSEEEILQMELVVLKTLNWSLSPITANAWAKYLLQLEITTATATANGGEEQPQQQPEMMCLDGSLANSDENGSIEDEELIDRKFSNCLFSKIMHLLDLCTLDIQSLNFHNASLAASAIFFCQDGLLPNLPKGMPITDHMELSGFSLRFFLV